MSFLPTAKMPPTLQSNISCCRKLHWLWISFFVSTGDLIVTLNKVRLNKQLQLVWRERINTSTWDWHLPQSNPDNFLTSLSVGLKETREQFPGTVIVSLPVIRVNLKSNLKQGAKCLCVPWGGWINYWLQLFRLCPQSTGVLYSNARMPCFIDFEYMFTLHLFSFAEGTL